ncbi:hypothetical protein [Vulcanisaeta distributa]|uniref:hypothetical protein n=1 Tax=Vulcanisaeta distributa TaxID=164451 RepID=UPI000A53D4D1|nr:hypothetical protein [Vulcanisaeta distributa]
MDITGIILWPRSVSVILFSIALILGIALIIHSITRINSIRSLSTRIKRIEIKNDLVILSTINSTHEIRLSEIAICHKAIMGRGYRPYAYNVFINHQGTTYKIPHLKPEDYGALRQVLKSHGIDISECQARQ